MKEKTTTKKTKEKEKGVYLFPYLPSGAVRSRHSQRAQGSKAIMTDKIHSEPNLPIRPITRGCLVVTTVQEMQPSKIQSTSIAGRPTETVSDTLIPILTLMLTQAMSTTTAGATTARVGATGQTKVMGHGGLEVGPRMGLRAAAVWRRRRVESGAIIRASPDGGGVAQQTRVAEQQP